MKFFEAVKESLKENLAKFPRVFLDLCLAVLLVGFLFLPVFLVAVGLYSGLLSSFFLSLSLFWFFGAVLLLGVISIFWFVFWIGVLSKMEKS